MCQAAGEVI